MFNRIQLESFKCFRKLALPLAPITVLAGVNATGKSTILQALTLLHQTLAQNEWGSELLLNGESLALGTARDVTDHISGQRALAIGLESANMECRWRFETVEQLSLSMPVHSVTWREAPDWQWKAMTPTADDGLHFLLPNRYFEQSAFAQQLASALRGLIYLSADRLGPRETHTVGAALQSRTVGPRGERTLGFLLHFEDITVNTMLQLTDAPPTLQRQVEAWMGHFFPGVKLASTRMAGTNLATLGIRTNDATDWLRPQNVGYGLSHVLPIIAACLGAQPSQLVLIENPESHLHPSGQSAMGEFLAMVASAGVQVVVETHSDHILNGLRRAVKKQMLSPEQVAIHFFTPRREDETEGPAQVISPLIDTEGNLDHWPAGFFDQFDRDNAELLGWG